MAQFLPGLGIPYPIRSHPTGHHGEFMNIRTASLFCLYCALSAALLAADPAGALPECPALPEGTPDMTDGEGPALKGLRNDWYLHCGGTRGWIYRDDKDKCDLARQILVTKVPAVSPVRRQLQVGDVILGVKGTFFSRHAVYEFREASKPAQRSEGTFEIFLWRKGWKSPKRVVLDLSHKPLDFTKGDTPGLAVDWNLGPTGARGWMQGQHEESIKARQIYITKVHKGSPADGILQPKDVILGVNGKPFDRDARRALAEAITLAETEAGKGQLKLLHWRAGTRGEVTIQLPVLGSYSKATPWDCPKSTKVLENACAYLIKTDVLNKNSVGSGPANVAALALLATGDPDHEKLAKAYVYKLLGSMESFKGHPPVWGYATWGWGYGNLLMTEYFLLTRDEKVLPAIQRYSDMLARGQSGAGSWGHRMALTGHGPCHGYGSMNQCGTIAWMSLILAKRCGITNPEIERAISLGRDYLTTFLGKQPVPYGDHINLRPNAHDDNGKSSAAACAHALFGDRKGTDFYSRMTVASYAVREHGHTGSWWSSFWGPLGAARAGKLACAAFLHEMAWLHDLERRWDGGFIYQGKAGVGYGVDPKSGRQKGGREHNNGHWDTTGARILMYCLPKQRLCITGRDALTIEIPENEIASLIEAGRPHQSGNKNAVNRFQGESADRLRKRLGSWSPVERYHAASALARIEGISTATIVPLLKSDNMFARYGACQALRELKAGAAGAVPALIEQLQSNDQLLLAYAIAALGEIGDNRAVEPLLKKAAGTFEGDVTGVMQRMVARALFNKGGLLKESIDGVNREVLFPAIRGILACRGGHERSMMAEAVLPRLTLKELQPLWPVLIPALRECAPTGVMFASGVRTTIASILAENKVEEGMDLLLEYMKLQKRHGGGGKRNILITDLIKSYGANARPLIPAIETYIQFCEQDRPWTDVGQPSAEGFFKNQVPHLKDTIKVIRESKETPELISIKSHLKK